MKQTLTQCNPEDVSEELADLGRQPQRRIRSYRPTPWIIVNRLLDIADDVTGGRADWCQRFITYLFIGGFAALVNLAVFYLVFYCIPLPVSNVTHNLIAYVLACEISIMANFVPNDYFTFRHLSGHDRSWQSRCLRYHITSIGGSVLTLLIQFGFTYLGHVPAIVSQAGALILVLIYNFSFHHLFTYRQVKPATN
ncbi:GtrA family protein [Ktedonosporobacter rubrisoli]|uniref:GtrA family protein n=1 Tax=Ktedonosporobacter rubrisoli TaxID=2509675 RepID=A0A4P6JU27_KTERU|nr:GtrA family protein [Ktedonosporobacter rubrisoli]QBD78426.1 GtrA family protein [Ktedonosporobacter rubrisoli]